jgi:hypothetical protein
LPLFRQACDVRLCGREHDAGAPWRSFLARQDWECAFIPQIEQQVEALRYREWEALALDRMHRMAVDCDDMAGQVAEVDPELTGRGAANDPQPDATATFHAHD